MSASHFKCKAWSKPNFQLPLLNWLWALISALTTTFSFTEPGHSISECLVILFPIYKTAGCSPCGLNPQWCNNIAKTSKNSFEYFKALYVLEEAKRGEAMCYIWWKMQWSRHENCGSKSGKLNFASSKFFASAKLIIFLLTLKLLNLFVLPG